MIKFLLCMLLLKSPALLSYNASTFNAGAKRYVGFTMNYSEPLPQQYSVGFQVTYSTAALPITINYVVMLPEGTFGTTSRAFEIPGDYSISSYSLTSEGPYNQ